MDGLTGDLRVSLRQLAKAPGFTAAAIVVLALGIGLNSAMFSMVYAIGMMGRPYAEPDRLMQLYSSQTREPDSYRAFSFPAYLELAAQGDLFDGVLAHDPTIVAIGQGADTRRTFGMLVSRNYFDVLGVPIIQGRGFTEDESAPGRDVPVVIVTYRFWQHSGFDPALVGKTLRINERDYTIVGITPRGFTGTMMVFGPELFFPLGVFHTLSNDFQGGGLQTLQRADAYHLFLVGRLRDGVSQETASARLQLSGERLERAFPAEYRDARVTIGLLPRFGTSTSPSDESALTLFAAVMLGLTAAVLLVVCLNLASMLLARGRARRKEFAIRLALGGGRSRIVRQLLVEGLLLSIAGGAIGVALGLFGVDALVSAFASMLPISIVLEGAVSPAVVVATFFFCLLATVWFALGPALQHSRTDVLSDLKPAAGDDVVSRRRRFMPRNPLVVGQVALSLGLLIAAGLFIRMAHTAIAVDFGFNADDTVLAEVDGKLAGYTTPQVLDRYRLIEQQLAALPGVDSASVGALVPLGMVNISRAVRRAGLTIADGAKPQTPEEGRAYDTPWNAVSGRYFATMGLRLRQGRTFTDVESFAEAAPAVVVIDDALARKLWPEGNALGQRLQYNERETTESRSREFEIVGIVSAARRELFEKEWPGGVYVPFAQGALANAYFHVRPAQSASDWAVTVRNEIRKAAPGLPVFSAKTFASHMTASIEYWALRLSAGLFGLFGALAMIVALVGIYGVMSYAVVRRTREIGIRIAVGAVPTVVRRMILSESLSVTLLGVGLGWLLGIGVGRLLGNIFVDVASFDLLTFTVVPVVFTIAGVAAAWLPARRATKVSPMTALRAD
jgi:putative ABC transport system permease protein